ncbi:MAG: SPOR domain-containing protein, partial [Pseudomonadota bacterium]
KPSQNARPNNGRDGYAELPDQSGGYSPYDDARRGPMILLLAVGVLVVFLAVVWNAYKRGVREGDVAGLPQIAAEGAYKSRPDNPGGWGDLDTDKLVFDQVDGSTRNENVAPRQVREEPVPIEARAGGGLSSKKPNASSIEPTKPLGRTVGEKGAPLDLRAGGGATEIAPKPIQKPQPREFASTTPKPAPTPTPKPTQVPKATSEPTPQPAAPAARATAIFEPDGRFVVQLSSLRSSAAADAQWAKITGENEKLFSGAVKLVQTADLGEKGVYHRLRAGAFATRDDATAFCNTYKQAGGDCLVTAR